MMNCDQVIAALGEYLDEPSARELRAHIEAHLAHCGTCQVIYDSLRKTLRLVTDSGSFEIPRAFSERLSDRIIEEIRRRSARTAQQE